MTLCHEEHFMSNQIKKPSLTRSVKTLSDKCRLKYCVKLNVLRLMKIFASPANEYTYVLDRIT